MRAEIERFAPGIGALDAALPELLVGEDLRRFEVQCHQLVDRDVPHALASRIARIDSLLSGLDIIDVARETEQPVRPVAATYFQLGHRLHLDRLLDRVGALPRDERWQTLARSSLRGDLYACQRTLVAEVVRGHDLDRLEPAALLDVWEERRAPAVDRYRHVVREFENDETPDLAALSVAVRAARELASA
jgi:glutamate dehydrogenase